MQVSLNLAQPQKLQSSNKSNPNFGMIKGMRVNKVEQCADEIIDRIRCNSISLNDLPKLLQSSKQKQDLTMEKGIKQALIKLFGITEDDMSATINQRNSEFLRTR